MSTTISGTSGVTFPDSTSMQTGQQACKAWVNFNGTGTVAIRESYNVSSITDNQTGDYTVNFTTAMPDANYAEAISAGSSTGIFLAYYPAITKTSSALRLRTAGISAQSLTDVEWVSASIFSN